MKRIILMGVVAVAAMAVCVTAAATTIPAKNATEGPVITQAKATQPSRITEEDAKRIALERVGLKEKDVTFINVNLDYDDGRYYYDVEFYHDIEEYDFEIDAYSGEVIEFDYDVENYELKRAPAPEPTVETAAPAPAPAPQKNSSGGISEGEAKKKALARAGVREKDVSYIYVEHEFDDGLSVYNVEFVAGTTEYECEVDANSGAIIEYDAESIYD